MVSIFANGSLLGTALADANGKWVFTPNAPLAEGLQKFTITAADVAGNQSAPSAPYEIIVDTLRPQAPKIVSVEDDVGEVQGPLQKGATTDDAQPTIKGTAEANSTVVISDNGGEIGRVQAGADGKWSFTPALALSGGAHGITVIALDSAGNASVPSDGFDFTVMVPPPVRASAPTIVSIYDDVGLVKGELSTGAVTDDTKPLIKGRGDPRATIVLKDNGVEIGRTQVNDSGDWSFLPTSVLSFGLHNLIAATVDGAGNSSLPSNMFGFRVAAPGTGGALENFATADQWGVGETYVFPSGLVLEGTYYNGSVLSYYDGGGMRPEDRWNVLNRTGEKLVFSLPVESKKISFYHVANTGNSYARFLDVNGNIIGKITLIQNSGPEKVYFTAPAGKFVASIEVSSDIDANIAIGGLKWGERTPLDVTIAAAEADGFGGRYVWGKVLGIDTIPPGMALQITTDGGATWTNASVREGSWAASQKDMPAG
ncbi:MAG TPA: hypothetical protein DCY59_01090, partial [Micrococcaceae bacterium]|nr:hypothetical protein [Micrococcaceae bacterium]